MRMEKHYILKQDGIEAERLRVQYTWMNKTLGFKIHPMIDISSSKEDLWVADIATGTGLFPLDIANDLPKSARVFGFDITDAHFPTKEIPENVKFCQHDMRTPFPEEYLGKFDLVCIRLVQLGLRGEEWRLAVKQLVTLLKPGGYIQWLEPDHSKSQILHNKAGAPAAATKEIFKAMNTWFAEVLQPGAVLLADIFGENGLEVTTQDVFGTDRVEEDKAYHTTMLIETGGRLAGMHLVKTGKNTQEQVDELISKAVQESRNGDIYQHSELYLVVGRKKQ